MHLPNASIKKDSCRFNPGKKQFLIGLPLVASGSFLLLNQLWYKDFPRSSFHLFNDSKEWLQVDKVGHFASSWFLGVNGIQWMRKSSFKNPSSVWLGGSLGLIFLSGIECLDATSEAWGFSWSDMAANAAGAAMAISQDLLWHDQRFMLRFSYRNSGLSDFRSGILGATFPERLFKDYNAQSYWLAASPFAFSQSASLQSMRWLGLSLGYGANGMLGARGNYFENKGVVYDFSSIPRRREWFLALDIDLSHIPVRSQILKKLSKVFSCIHIPAPGFYYSQNQVSARLFCY